MTKTIIVGVDGSAPAREAANTAARLASALSATLHVVSVFDPNSGRDRDGEFDPALASSRIAADAAGTLRSVYPGLNVLGQGVAGHKPAEALVEAAEKLDADLIVVGNKRVQGLGRLLGSIASEVAAKAHCDVYVAHTHD